MATIKEYQDKYNNSKVWVVKRTACGHYYLNQKINGKLFYPRFQRVSLTHIKDIIEWEEM